MAKSYRDLDIYKISFDLFIRTHQFSFKMPKHETYELGSQIRRSADSVNSNIVEGYGRKRYKRDFIKFLIYSHSSNDETVNHLKKIAMVYPNLEDEAKSLANEYDQLGAKIFNFIKYVESNWRTWRGLPVAGSTVASSTVTSWFESKTGNRTTRNRQPNNRQLVTDQLATGNHKKTKSK